MIAESYRSRYAATRNASAVSSTHTFNASQKDEVVGAFVDGRVWGRWDCELRMIDANYWCDQKWFSPKFPDGALIHASSQTTASSGMTKILARHRQQSEAFGAIESREDVMIRSGKLNYWFNLTFDDVEHFPLTHMLKNVEAVRFRDCDISRGTIRISLDTRTLRNEESREIELDTTRGFVPVAIRRTVRVLNAAPDTYPFYIQDIKIEEFREVGGIWFPWKMRELNFNQELTLKNEVTVHDTVTHKVELGKLKEGDLELVFPTGTKVHDRINGVWLLDGKEFHMGSEGKEPVSGKTSGTPELRSRRSQVGYFLAGNCVVGVGLLVVWFALRHRLSSK